MTSSGHRAGVAGNPLAVEMATQLALGRALGDLRGAMSPITSDRPRIGFDAEHPGFHDIIARALHEDLDSGDVTSRCTVPLHRSASAQIVAKSALVFCGEALVHGVVEAVDPSMAVEMLVRDGGDWITTQTTLLRLRGSARSMLVAERTILNLLTRACAVASHTRRFVDLAGPRLRVVDTRKTMPGLRALDRYAVRCGGAHNHRNDLGSGVLIKENHIRAAGSIEAAIAGAKAGAVHGMRVECEVSDLDELDRAVEAGADIVMLDNMSDAEIESAAERHAQRVILEVSGGVTLERMPSLARLGAHVVSVGAITHSPPAVDMSLLFDLDGETRGP